jgi:hypothetical protein
MSPSRFISRIKKEVRHVPQASRAHVRDSNLIAHKHDDRLHEVAEPGGDFPTPDAAGHQCRCHDEQRRGQPDEDDVFRDRQIQRQPADMDRGKLGKRDIPERRLEHRRIGEMVQELGENIPLAVASLRPRVQRVRNRLCGMCRVSHQRHLNPDS